MSRARLFWLYTAAMFLMGLGTLAILPPFEGFDETAHFSSLRQIAGTGTIPFYGQSRIDTFVETYAKQGPSAYGTLAPPFDKDIISYRRFFADPALVQHYMATYTNAPITADFAPGGSDNWQAQHPPLYYLLLAPLLNATDHLSFISQVFVLRLASYITALLGVMLGFAAALRTAKAGDRNAVRLGFLFYPILLPMFFPEFARIGNDALCLFWSGLLAYLLTLWFKNPAKKRLSMSIGAILGLGILTKAFFIPITLALFIFSAFQFSLQKKRGSYRMMAWLFAPTLIIGLGWYIANYMTRGALVGSNDGAHLAAQGGLIANLHKNFSLIEMARGFAVTFVSWIWAGSWSLARMPALLQLPLVVLVAGVLIAAFRKLQTRPANDPFWLPAIMLAMFTCGFAYHIFQSLALSGNGGTPGWYLHILMPWTAPLLGLGITSLWRNRRLKLTVLALLSYAAFFQLFAIWAQFALFTGCAVKGDNKLYHFSSRVLCFDQLPGMVQNLSVTGWPWLAVIGYGGGILAVIVILRMAREDGLSPHQQ